MGTSWSTIVLRGSLAAGVLVGVGLDVLAQTPPARLLAWGVAGSEPGSLQMPLRMDLPDPEWSDNDAPVFVVDGMPGARRVQQFGLDGSFVRVLPSLVDPVAVAVIEDVAIGGSGMRVAVLDRGVDQLILFDVASAVPQWQWSLPAFDDGDVVFDLEDPSLWVCLGDRHVVQQYALDGTLLRTLGFLDAPGDAPDRFDGPRGLEVTAGQVFVADTGNDRVVRLWWDAGGAGHHLIGGGTGSAMGELSEPWSVTVDCRGRALVVDRGNARVQRFVTVDGDPDPGVYVPTLVADAVWFDDGTSFGDLIDLVDPRGLSAVVGLPGADRGARRDVIGGSAGLWTLDTARAEVGWYEDLCCVGSFPTDQITVETAGGDLLIAPAGTGPTLASIGATVFVEILDSCGEPIAGFPFQDLYLDDAPGGTASFCVGGNTADANTDGLGRTTFSGPLAGGGSSPAGLILYLSGVPYDTALPIRVVSPDLDGDLVVDLADLALFATDYFGPFQARSDLDANGILSLSDIALFAAHNGERCP